MRWTFFGYAATLYAAFVALAAMKLPTDTDPVAGAFAYLVLLPALAIGLGAEGFIHGSKEDRGALDAALARGAMRRQHALFAGVVAGSFVVVVVGTAYWAATLDIGFQGMLLVGCVVSFVVAPPCAYGWTIYRAKQLADHVPGFPVIPKLEGEARPRENRAGR